MSKLKVTATLLAICACAQALTPTIVSTPKVLLSRQNAVSDVIRYTLHGSFILGDTLYIDGGEFSTSDFEAGHQINNNTWSIDLSKTFSTKRVNSNPPVTGIIEKGDCPSLARPAFWVDETRQEAYTWGGEWDAQHEWIPSDVPPEALWAFTANNSGTWRNIPQGFDQTFSTLTRSDFGTSTYGGNAGGFYLGGWHDQWTSQKTDHGDTASTGLVYYNFANQSWSNFSTSEFYDGTYMGFPAGGSQFVPSFGQSGLLIVFGGKSWSGGLGSYPWNNITVFDLATQRWFSQPTTEMVNGDTPQSTYRYCSVGKEGTNGTYEIFVYGGTLIDDVYVLSDDTQSDIMYVLSLPAFVWHKTNATSGDYRAGHTCNLFGNRRMLSVGGLDPHLNSTTDQYGMSWQWNTTDPYTFGVKVFDLTTLSWLDDFEPSDEPYQEPQFIKDFYASNQRYPQRWNDESLQDLFLSSDKSNSTTTSPPAKATSRTNSGSSHTGAIAGGVVGGIIFIAVACAAVWWFCVKNRKSGHDALLGDHKASIHEIPDPSNRYEHEIGQGMLSPEGRWELSAQQKTPSSY